MFSSGRSTVTLKDIKDRIGEANIIYKYLGITKIPCVIPSPLRSDRKPSFGIYSRDGIRIYWVDFATKERGNLYDLLSKLWLCSFPEVLSRIQRDFITPNNNIVVQKSSRRNLIINNSKVDLKCKVREWRDYDIAYWESYGVPLKWLKYAEVYPVSHKIIYKNENKYVFGADKYAYAFVERKEGKITLKIYQPFNTKGYKWANKHDGSVISLWTKIPLTGNKVVICSSLKDALCLWANTGIPTLAIQGEGYSISDTAISELKRRYKEIYILLDNDKAGLEDAEKLANETGFTNLVLPKEYGCKDISDLFKKIGKEKFVQIVKVLFDNTDSLFHN